MNGQRDDRDGVERVLSDALHDALPEPPADTVDWSGLHARIMRETARGSPRRAALWWEQVAAWTTPRLAATAAALIVATAALLLATGRPALPGDVAAAPEFHTIEEELAYGSPDGARPVLLADPGGDALVDALLFYDWEER